MTWTNYSGSEIIVVGGTLEGGGGESERQREGEYLLLMKNTLSELFVQLLPNHLK